MTPSENKTPEAKTELYLSREQIAEAMTKHIQMIMPDEAVAVEHVVEVPAAHSDTFAQCKVWTACCGPFIMIAVNYYGEEFAAVYMHS